MRFPAHCLTLLLCLASLPVLAAALPAVVGERHGQTHSASAAVRDAAHRDSLRYTVWYPAAAGTREQPITIGPPDAPLFNVGSAGIDAAIVPGPLPTLLLSHGNGGSARMMGWFGIAMARAGYLVIAVDHPGNNGVEAMTLAGSILIWERAEDLKAALAAVQADPQLGPRVDASRLGVAGFSAGGFTALAAAGARVDLAHLLAFCRASPDDGVCRPQLEMPGVTLQARIDAAATPGLAPYMAQAGDDHRVPGVRAAFLMAPAIVQAFTPDTLARLSEPLSIVLGDADGVAPPSTNGNMLATHATQATLRTLPDVGHYDFLAACTPLGRQRIPALCPPPVSQAAAHAAAIEQALQLFAQTLAPSPAAPTRPL
ncbi:hypothetical protein KQ945_07185 [Bacillus subtilis subsp. subtilis]|nr:hypothetical protein [Bacillus subtilis subsp. subtilis]